MARLFISIALATLVGLSAVGHVDAEETTQAKKGRVSITPLVIVKHFDKSSASLL